MHIRSSLLLVGVLACLLVGCGGGGTPRVAGRTTTGRATFTVRWPARARLIPDASNSIVVAITQESTTLATQTLARPASGGTASATFSPLPTGTLSLTATAFPNTDGSGVAQATATAPLVIQANQNTSFSVTMNSTIDHLQLTAPSTSLAVGRTVALAVAGKDATGATVLLSPAKLTWLSSNTAVAAVDTSGKVTAVAAGSADISVTDTESGKSAKVTMLVHTVGPISFQTPILYNITSPNEVVPADFDGDGKIDLAVGTNTSLVVFWGKGDGTFTGPQTVLTWTGGVTPWSAADMNGDGKPDIVCTVANQFVVLNNLGGRQFSAPLATPLSSGPGSLATGDFNGDGKPDVAVTTGNPGSTATDIHIFKNNGDGTYTEINSFRNIWIITAMRAADLNGDGKIDLLVSIYTDIVGTSGTNIYYGDGTGHFTNGPGVGTGTLDVKWTALADFNGDGLLDYAVANSDDGSVSVLINAGNNSYKTPATYPANAYPDHLAAADLNGDGAPDIVVESRDANYITVMPNQNGLFPNLLTFPTNTPCGPIAVADFNGDGKPDVVVSSPSGNSIAILLNNSQ